MIGITERGDPSICLEWIGRTDDLDGVILITKNPGAFINSELETEIEKIKDKLIIHCSITGYGGTVVEPKVNPYNISVMMMKELINKGYNIVLRIDPVIPTPKGLERVQAVIDYTKKLLGSLNDIRIRFSLIDNYTHAKERGLSLPWDSFHVPAEDGDKYLGGNTIIRYFKYIEETEAANIEVCAEGYSEIPHHWHTGCVSANDYTMIGKLAPKYVGDVHTRQRNACLCINQKKELLDNRVQCAYECKYCYWKNSPINNIDASEVG